MRKIWLLSLAFVAGMMSAAHADQRSDAPYQPKHVPVCTKYMVPGVGQICGYSDIEDWKTILKVDAELTELRAEVDAVTHEAASQALRAQALADALALRQADLDASRRTVDLERANLKERDRLYQNEKARPRWGTKLSWGLAGVSTVAAVVFGAIVFAR